MKHISFPRCHCHRLHYSRSCLETIFYCTLLHSLFLGLWQGSKQRSGRGMLTYVRTYVLGHFATIFRSFFFLVYYFPFTFIPLLVA